ncbi:amino acid ABC transporter permease [Prauserella alba]|uniref:Amino acid ABC transporter permease n=1 Tax=Prauserella alba TaxID=176898 RepID=A0ABN1VGL3_9PSEU|nr:amino acid ABC transporter permease [Prauserella alba]MCP2182881.1 polar amino acid transport system permease protein [Prauserella alba]
MTFLADWAEWLPSLLQGLGTSLLLTLCVAGIGFPLGLGLALLSIAPARIVRILSIAFIEIFRGIPLLVVIFFAYFGFPDIELVISAFATIVVAHSLNLGAYSSEVFRAGILHVGPGQREAARSLGLTPWHAFSRVVLPQALRAVPGPLMSFLIMVFQSTSLAFAIGVGEMTSQAFSIGSMTFDYLSVLVLAGIIYAIICVVSARIVARFEAKMRT